MIWKKWKCSQVVSCSLFDVMFDLKFLVVKLLLLIIRWICGSKTASRNTERQRDKTCFMFQWKLHRSTVCISFSLTVQSYMMPGRVQVTGFICQIREAIRGWEVQIFFICTVTMKGDNKQHVYFFLEIRYIGGILKLFLFNSLISNNFVYVSQIKMSFK